MDENALNELLECSVCLESLDASSRVLPCQHTFCKRCLDEIVQTKAELRCPECRTLVKVKVEDLPLNILLVRLLEGMKTARSVASTTPRAATMTSSSSLCKSFSSPCAKALYTYEGKEPGDLSFKKGDLILVRRRVDENWLQGEVFGRQGFFPCSYVQMLASLPHHSPKCRTLYDFNLSHDNKDKRDCLSFRKDEVLLVIRRIDDNWLEGKLANKIGIFPMSFVEMNDSAKWIVTLQASQARSATCHSSHRRHFVQSSATAGPSSFSKSLMTGHSSRRSYLSPQACVPVQHGNFSKGSGAVPTNALDLLPQDLSVHSRLTAPLIPVAVISSSAYVPVTINPSHESPLNLVMTKSNSQHVATSSQTGQHSIPLSDCLASSQQPASALHSSAVLVSAVGSLDHHVSDHHKSGNLSGQSSSCRMPPYSSTVLPGKPSHASAVSSTRLCQSSKCKPQKAGLDQSTSNRAAVSGSLLLDCSTNCSLACVSSGQYSQSFDVHSNWNSSLVPISSHLSAIVSPRESETPLQPFSRSSSLSPEPSAALPADQGIKHCISSDQDHPLSSLTFQRVVPAVVAKSLANFEYPSLPIQCSSEANLLSSNSSPALPSNQKSPPSSGKKQAPQREATSVGEIVSSQCTLPCLPVPASVPSSHVNPKSHPNSLDCICCSSSSHSVCLGATVAVSAISSCLENLTSSSLAQPATATTVAHCTTSVEPQQQFAYIDAPPTLEGGESTESPVDAMETQVKQVFEVSSANDVSAVLLPTVESNSAPSSIIHSGNDSRQPTTSLLEVCDLVHSVSSSALLLPPLAAHEISSMDSSDSLTDNSCNESHLLSSSSSSSSDNLTDVPSATPNNTHTSTSFLPASAPASALVSTLVATCPSVMLVSTSNAAVVSTSFKPAAAEQAARMTSAQLKHPSSSSLSNALCESSLPTVSVSSSVSKSAQKAQQPCIETRSTSMFVVMALYNYKPQKLDELLLRKGDYYSVSEQCQDGWFKGACMKTGQVGVFPGNYVQLENSLQKMAAPTSFAPGRVTAPLDVHTQLCHRRRPITNVTQACQRLSVGRPSSSVASGSSVKMCVMPDHRTSTRNANGLDRSASSVGVSSCYSSAVVGSSGFSSTVLAALNPAVDLVKPSASVQRDKGKKGEKMSLVKRLTKVKRSKSTKATCGHSHESRSDAAHRPTADDAARLESAGNPRTEESSSKHTRTISMPVEDDAGDLPAIQKMKCITAYPPQSEFELELRVGDVIFVHKSRRDGWFKGTLHRTGQTGLFPASFAQPI